MNARAGGGEAWRSNGKAKRVDVTGSFLRLRDNGGGLRPIGDETRTFWRGAFQSFPSVLAVRSRVWPEPNYPGAGEKVIVALLRSRPREVSVCGCVRACCGDQEAAGVWLVCALVGNEKKPRGESEACFGFCSDQVTKKKEKDITVICFPTKR